jgi:hypothetical protein
MLFDDYYKDCIVEWEGFCVSVKKNDAKFRMDPTETTISDSDITLTNPVFANVTENKKCRFRGKIVDYGGKYFNHKLDAVPVCDDMKVDFDISWEEFVFLFGSKSRYYPDLLFEKFWKSLYEIFYVLFFFFQKIIQ